MTNKSESGSTPTAALLQLVLAGVEQPRAEDKIGTPAIRKSIAKASVPKGGRFAMG
jgi:hypothetical protein